MAQWGAQGKTFLVTGGASGLGAAYVEAFLKDGAKNVAILDVAVEVGKAKTESLKKTYGDKVIFIKCDVSKEEDISKAFDEVVAKFKQVDVIINNAGIMFDTPNMWRTASDVNWAGEDMIIVKAVPRNLFGEMEFFQQGLVSLTLKGVTHMRKDEGGAGGTIVNISSTAGLTRSKYLPVYCGSKIAVLHFTQCISMPPFFERTGVRMLTMCPGPTDTPLLHGLEKRGYDSVACKELAASVQEICSIFQKVESMVAAFVHMFKNGAPGSIWLAIGGKPAKDITSLVDNSFKSLEEVVYS